MLLFHRNWTLSDLYALLLEQGFVTAEIGRPSSLGVWNLLSSKSMFSERADAIDYWGSEKWCTDSRPLLSFERDRRHKQKLMIRISRKTTPIAAKIIGL